MSKTTEEGLNTVELQELMDLCSIYPEDFFGVQPCDIFLENAKKKKFSSNSRHIINLSSSNHSGSHWVCIMFKDKQALYFDSFGDKCYDKNILKVFEEMNMNFDYSNVNIQHNKSTYCGYFCIARILCDEVGISHDQFIKLFNQRYLYLNDCISVSIIKAFIDQMYRQ